jgi:hypothetical protein
MTLSPSLGISLDITEIKFLLYIGSAGVIGFSMVLWRGFKLGFSYFMALQKSMNDLNNTINDTNNVQKAQFEEMKKFNSAIVRLTEVEKQLAVLNAVNQRSRMGDRTAKYKNFNHTGS